MEVRAEIQLPFGTLFVPLKGIPGIFALALYPAENDGSWRMLRGFKKRFPPALSASFENPELDLDHIDWALLDKIFPSPPPFRKRMFDVDWQQYETTFENSKDKPQWQLVPIWDNREKDSQRLRIETEIAVLSDLMDSLRSGAFADPIEGLSRTQSAPIQFESGQFSIDELTRFAAKFHLAVRVAPSSERTHVSVNWNAGRYTIEEAARELSAYTGRAFDRCLELIVNGVKQGHLPLKNPRDFGDKLPYAVPSVVRVWYEHVTNTDLNSWLESNSEWGIKYRFATESVPVRAEPHIPLTSSVERTWEAESARVGREIQSKNPKIMKKALAADVHKALLKANCKGRGGKTLSVGTIMRRGLKGLTFRKQCPKKLNASTNARMHPGTQDREKPRI